MHVVADAPDHLSPAEALSAMISCMQGNSPLFIRQRTKVVRLFIAGLMTLFCACLAPAGDFPVDYARLADVVVHRALQLEPGERVVIFGGADQDRGMAAALRAAIGNAAGELEEIPAPDSRLDAALTTRQKTERYGQWRAAFERSQAAIWLPSDLAAADDRPFEHLVEASHVRSIHFHWFLPPEAADIPAVEAMYQRAIELDPEEIIKRTAGVERAIRGHAVRVRAPNGTDLTFKVPADAHIHRNTGTAVKEKVRTARSIRDREEELPAGVVRTTDVVAAEGTFVGHVSWDRRSGLVKATFHGGKVTRLESLRGADVQVQAWRGAHGDKDRPGEFVVSTNPALAAVMESGFMPYYGYGAGVVRIAIGDNWESGGTNRSSNGEFLLFLPGATLTADGSTLVDSGIFVAR